VVIFFGNNKYKRIFLRRCGVSQWGRFYLASFCKKMKKEQRRKITPLFISEQNDAK